MGNNEPTPNKVLEDIIDDITMESAMDVNEEYTQIICAYMAMSKVIAAVTEPTTITTESGSNTFDDFVVEQLETMGLTKDYFGFTDNLTVESAQITIEIDGRWKKMWEWIKSRIIQLKEWLVKVYKAIFNKNNTLLQTITELEKIQLGELTQTSVNKDSFLNLADHLPNYNTSLVDYSKGLVENWDRYNMVIDNIIKNSNKEPSSVYDELRLSYSFTRILPISNVLSHSVYSVKGVLFHMATITNPFAQYYTIDGSSSKKIVRTSYEITNNNKKQNDKVLNVNNIKLSLSELKKIVLDIDKNSAALTKKLSSTLDIYKGHMDGLKGDDIDKLQAIVLLIMGRLSVTDFTLREINKMVRAIAIHIKCYK